MERGDTAGDVRRAEPPDTSPAFPDDDMAAAVDSGRSPTVDGPSAEALDHAAMLTARPVYTEIPEDADIRERPEVSDTGPEASDTDGDGTGAHGNAGATEFQRVMERLDEAAALVDELRGDLNRLGQHLSTDRVSDQMAVQEQIGQQVRELRQGVIELAGKGRSQDPALPAAVAAKQAALATEAKQARTRFRGDDTTSGLWSRIWKAVKRVAPHLWVLIARLTRVREWSVNGQVAGGLPGLGLASASMTITFG